jgi:hypothetical protein
MPKQIVAGTGLKMPVPASFWHSANSRTKNLTTQEENIGKIPQGKDRPRSVTADQIITLVRSLIPCWKDIDHGDAVALTSTAKS